MKKLCFLIIVGLFVSTFSEASAQSSTQVQSVKPDQSGLYLSNSQEVSEIVLEKAAKIFGVSTEELEKQYDSGEVVIQEVEISKFRVRKHGNEVLIMVDAF